MATASTSPCFARAVSGQRAALTEKAVQNIVMRTARRVGLRCSGRHILRHILFALGDAGGFGEADQELAGSRVEP